jgi:D-cysteine desulfhydrase
MSESGHNNRPLFARYPGLRDKLPFMPLGDLPTPVAPMRQLGARLGIEELWIKRDDISAPDYGGNKIRKLEFLLADARQCGCTTVLTFGGLGSNHALATALNCTRLGLNCVAVLTPEPVTEAVRRALRYHQLLGTRIALAHHYAETRTTADKLTAEIGAAEVYEVPFGGSSWLGAVGFVNAGLEIADQITAGQLPRPDKIYLGCGTTGSTAGLALGLRYADLPITVEAVQVTPDSVQPVELCAALVADTSRHLNALDDSIPLLTDLADRYTVRRDQLGAGYAIPTDAAHEAAHLLLEEEQVSTSLTYTAKTMAALIADARAGLVAGQRILFWNTYNSQPYPSLPDDDSWKYLPAELHAIFAD